MFLRNGLMHHIYQLAGKSFLVTFMLVSYVGADENPSPVISIQETAQKKQDPQPAKDKKQAKDKKSPKQDDQDPGNKQNKNNQEPKDEDSPTASPNTAAALNAYLSSTRRQFLGRTPRMFGDWFGPGIELTTFSEGPSLIDQIEGTIQLPQSGRVGKIAENNSALPFDRFFVNYSYFNNAYQASITGPDPLEANASPSIGRYTIGMERTFLDGLASIETRLVMNDVPDLKHNPGSAGYQTFSPTMGNLSFASKVLLIETESMALAAGMGIELPTGGDTYIKSRSTMMKIENQSIYLSPYIGLLRNPVDSPWFLNAFVQVECPLSGDGISGISTITGDTTDQGKYNSQTTLFVDVAVGRWLFQQQDSLVTGVAGFIEAHYNGSLNESDAFTDVISDGTFNTFYFVNPLQKQFNMVDLTAGLHIEIADQTKLRIAGVFPVSEQRPFDSELGIQISRYR